MKKIKNLQVYKNDDSSAKDEEQLYKILNELPKPDSKMKLIASQKYWWYFFGYEFLSTKQLTKLDLVHLQKAAFWMDARCKAIAKANTEGYEGLVQTFEKGYTNITGHVSIIEKADKKLDEVSSHFGLSIKDRQKLKSNKENPNQLNIFEQFLNQKTS